MKRLRIRSIKPEFWRSQDISRLRIEDRLLFIGLWSYVDDNGVGQDRVATVAADLFADDLERDPSETFARVSRGLQNLSEANRIVRYEVAGDPFLRIEGWAEHQRIDKPNKPRYPFENGLIERIFAPFATPSRDSRDTLAPGTEEQGNRGTEEQGRGNSGDASPPPPFCKRHIETDGTEHPCRACGIAGKKYDEYMTSQETPEAPHVHVHRWFPDGTCLTCDERKEAA